MRLTRESGSGRAVALAAVVVALVILQVCVVGLFEMLFPTLMRDWRDAGREDRTSQIVQGR